MSLGHSRCASDILKHFSRDILEVSQIILGHLVLFGNNFANRDASSFVTSQNFNFRGGNRDLVGGREPPNYFVRYWKCRLEDG